jgi:hypothetical protein
MSRNGRYQFISYRKGSSSGMITVMVSNDYGVSWHDTFSNASVDSIIMLACSESGQDVVLAYNSTMFVDSTIQISHDFGESWTLSAVCGPSCISLKMSGDGTKHVLVASTGTYLNGVRFHTACSALVGGTSGTALNDIYTATYECPTGYYWQGVLYKDGVRTRTFPSPFMQGKNFSSMVIARDNPDIAVLAVCAETAAGNCVLVTHDDWATYTLVDLSAPISGYETQLTKAAISDDGKYIVVGAGKNFTSSGQNGWHSSDYGVSFSRYVATPLLTLTDFTLSPTGQYGVASKHGNYAVPIYFTDDYGATWKPNGIEIDIVNKVKYYTKGTPKAKVVWPFTKD